jgi:flagellar motor switch protein FliN/FliY
MTSSPLAGNIHRSFSSAFFEALVAAITEASGSPWLVAAVPDPEATADGQEPLRINLTLDGSLAGEFLLEMRRTDAAMLGSRCLRQPTAAFGTEQLEVLLKVVEAGMNEFRSAAAEEYGIFTISAAVASELAPDRANVAEVTVTDDGGNRASILTYLDPALQQALSLHEEKAKLVGIAQTNNEQPNPELLNLKLVMGVELNVTLRFGQRQLALREILELASGSVIELDRQVEEPVELLLEGKVIARGEAVVIDGNYGLRVTEIPQPIPTPVLR